MRKRNKKHETCAKKDKKRGTCAIWTKSAKTSATWTKSVKHAPHRQKARHKRHMDKQRETCAKKRKKARNKWKRRWRFLALFFFPLRFTGSDKNVANQMIAPLLHTHTHTGRIKSNTPGGKTLSIDTWPRSPDHWIAESKWPSNQMDLQLPLLNGWTLQTEIKF